jgi:hypothetical protein
MTEFRLLKIVLVAIFVASPAFAQDQTPAGLQAAGCGPNETTFNVEIDKKVHTTGQPADGKALVYVFADEVGDNAKLVVGPAITRIGVDGQWMGAFKLKSYLYFSVDGGDHRLCVSLQSDLKSRREKYAAATTFTAESGKAYYFRTMTPVHPQPDNLVKIVPVDPAQAQLMIARAALSTSKPKN